MNLGVMVLHVPALWRPGSPQNWGLWQDPDKIQANGVLPRTSLASGRRDVSPGDPLLPALTGVDHCAFKILSVRKMTVRACVRVCSNDLETSSLTIPCAILTSLFKNFFLQRTIGFLKLKIATKNYIISPLSFSLPSTLSPHILSRIHGHWPL